MTVDMSILATVCGMRTLLWSEFQTSSEWSFHEDTFLRDVYLSLTTPRRIVADLNQSFMLTVIQASATGLTDKSSSLN
jgi:hypothetical protein